MSSCCECSWPGTIMRLLWRLSDRLLKQAEPAGRMGLVIEILILQALALQGKKETEEALVLLERP